MEYLYYFESNKKNHFIHEHQPEEVKGYPYIFLNPIFDEKKRSQRFYSETARELCCNGIPVIRFDYYGTGDSYGQLYEMNLESTIYTIKDLIDKVVKKYCCSKINLLGLRIGADIALNITKCYSENVNNVFLIEPVIIGKRFLLEQRSRRKMFFKINNMTNVQEKVIIDGKSFEDHQGYLISAENQHFLNNLDSTEVYFSEKKVIIIKLNTISSKKNMNQLKEKLIKNNSVLYYNFDYPAFWSILEPINTQSLSKTIIGKILFVSDIYH